MPKCITLYLVRHSESQGMREGIRLSPLSYITSRGRKQAIKLAKRLASLKLHFIYSSPTLRSGQTTEIIIKNIAHNNVIYLSDLVERRETSSLIGMATKDLPWKYLRKHRLNRFWRHQDAESFDDIHNRATRVLDKFKQHPPGSNILVISHGSFIRAMLAEILTSQQLSPKHYYQMTEKIVVAPAAISILKYSKEYYEENACWKLVSWMDSAHLL